MYIAIKQQSVVTKLGIVKNCHGLQVYQKYVYRTKEDVHIVAVKVYTTYSLYNYP